jgi:hypothetical protein
MALTAMMVGWPSGVDDRNQRLTERMRVPWSAGTWLECHARARCLPASVPADGAAVRRPESALRRKLVARALACRHYLSNEAKSTLAVTSMLSVLLLTLHITDGIVRGTLWALDGLGGLPFILSARGLWSLRAGQPS